MSEAAHAAVPTLSDDFFESTIDADEYHAQENAEATAEIKAEVLGQLEHIVSDLNQDEADYVRALLEEVHPQLTDEEIYESLDMRTEIATLVRITGLLKAKVMTPSGTLRNKVDVSDLKHTATSMIALTKQVKDMRADILNQERVRSIEKAVTAAMSTMDPKAQQAFIETLETELERTDD